MSKKTFNPHDWLKPKVPKESKSSISSISPKSTQGNFDNTSQDVETLIQAVESDRIDITSGYDNWLRIGFALADTFGEGGRSYYHRLSRFYPGYDEADTDKQFDKCRESHGSGVNIGTLFFIAQEHGITINSHNSTPYYDFQPEATDNDSQGEDLEDIENLEDIIQPSDSLPTFSQEVSEIVPTLLHDVVHKANNPDDADVLLLGAITVISACLPNITGIYGERLYHPNLFLFVSAKPSVGKGRLTLCPNLVQPIEDEIQKQNEEAMAEYQFKLNEYVLDKQNNQPPKEPPVKMLFIPGNSSATAVYQNLNESDSKGLIFASEADILSGSFKSDYGNYSEGLRCAFQHETITYSRRKDRELVRIKRPQLSVVISGTPRQILSLINDSENGLFSRFIFYNLNFRLEWLDVFKQCEEPADEYFNQLGLRFYEFYKQLKEYNQPIRVSLTESQQKGFNQLFKQLQFDYYYMFGEDIVPSVRRLGLITFRIIMVLTALRYMDNNNITQVMVCSDTDYNIAITMLKVLLKHTEKVYGEMPTIDSGMPNNGLTVICQTFYNKLPDAFNRKTYLSIAAKLNIPFKTADKHIKSFCSKGKLKHLSHGKYGKP